MVMLEIDSMILSSQRASLGVDFKSSCRSRFIALHLKSFGDLEDYSSNLRGLPKFESKERELTSARGEIS